MASDIKIFEDRKIIQRTVTGELHTERSIKLVRELAVAVKLNRGYSILMDLRDTVTRPDMLYLMDIATECSRHKYDFESKIAFLIPDTEDRSRVAELFKTCMEAQGFEFNQFTCIDDALAWLTA